jgi:predicted membrane metal-binding protein
MQIQYYKYPFITISFSIFLGILFGKYLIHFPVSLWLTLIFFLIAILLFRTPVLNVLLLFTLVSAASLRYHLATELYPENHVLTQDVNLISQFEGIVIDYQYRQDHRNKYLISLRQVSNADTQYSTNGNIYLYTKKIENKYDYGDRIQVKASLELPSGKRNPATA